VEVDDADVGGHERLEEFGAEDCGGGAWSVVLTTTARPGECAHCASCTQSECQPKQPRGTATERNAPSSTHHETWPILENQRRQVGIIRLARGRLAARLVALLVRKQVVVRGGYVCCAGTLEAARGFLVGDDAHDARVGKPGRVVVGRLWPPCERDGVDEGLEIPGARSEWGLLRRSERGIVVTVGDGKGTYEPLPEMRTVMAVSEDMTWVVRECLTRLPDSWDLLAGCRWYPRRWRESLQLTIGMWHDFLKTSVLPSNLGVASWVSTVLVPHIIESLSSRLSSARTAVHVESGSNGIQLRFVCSCLLIVLAFHRVKLLRKLEMMLERPVLADSGSRHLLRFVE